MGLNWISMFCGDTLLSSTGPADTVRRRRREGCDSKRAEQVPSSTSRSTLSLSSSRVRAMCCVRPVDADEAPSGGKEKRTRLCRAGVRGAGTVVVVVDDDGPAALDSPPEDGSGPGLAFSTLQAAALARLLRRKAMGRSSAALWSVPAIVPMLYWGEREREREQSGSIRLDTRQVTNKSRD